MNLTELLANRLVRVQTEIPGVTADLRIEKVTQNNHSRDLAPATAANDWWPPQETWSDYTVEFTNKYKKTYSSIEEINILPENPITEEYLKRAATNWVFETNKTKWSNNDDTAGDNFGSFIAGAKLVLDYISNKKSIQ